MLVIRGAYIRGAYILDFKVFKDGLTNGPTGGQTNELTRAITMDPIG